MFSTRTRLGAVLALVALLGTFALIDRANAAPGWTLRIAAASASDYTDGNGTTWSSDRYYQGGTASGQILGELGRTPDDTLYGRHRWGMHGYSIPVPSDAMYRVTLHFAEVVFGGGDKRVFDVSIEGAPRLRHLDVAAEVGYAKVDVKRFEVAVTDGKLDLGFHAIVEDPMISAIEVERLAAESIDTPGTEPPVSTTAPPTTATPTTVTPTTATPTTAPPPTTTSTTSPPTVTPSTGFPDASNTGVPRGVTLASSGGFSTSRDGQVIDALDVSGSIQVVHNNVTIRRTRIHHPGGTAVLQDPSKTGLVIEDSELDGSGNGNAVAAVGFANYTVRRTNIHHFGEGLTASGNNVIEDNYLHDFVNYISQGAHQDGIQVEWGSNVTIRHNTILQNVDGANSAIWVSAGNPHSNVVIDNNLVAGAGFSIGLGNQARGINNKVSTRYYPQGGYWGPFTYTSGAPMSGNVWYESGNAI